jgi:hypothetical protein
MAPYNLVNSENHKFFKLITTLTPVSETIARAKGDFFYLYEAKDETTKEGKSIFFLFNKMKLRDFNF